MALTRTSSTTEHNALGTGKLAADVKTLTDYANAQDNGSYYMQGNATATTITVADTFYKIAGTTTAGSLNSGFTHDNNSLTATSSYIRRYAVAFKATFTAGNNNVLTFAVAVNGTVNTESEALSTASSAGAGENIYGFATIELDPAVTADYVEIWVANASQTNVTVSRLQVRVTPIS